MSRLGIGFCSRRLLSGSLSRSCAYKNAAIFTFPKVEMCQPRRYKRTGDNKPTNTGKSVTSLFMPVPVKATSNPDDINIGEEISSKLAKDGILKLLNQFSKRPPVLKLAEEQGLDMNLFNQAFTSFRKFCMETEALPVDLHVTFSDLLQSAGHIDDLYPFFLHHARQVFPHIDCMEDLRKISDSRLPANWYPEARAINRKIIFHVGPTNSGKTYHALERFASAKTGIYCGPLKLLAAEVYTKTNARGTPCDLITGEEQKFANKNGSRANHLACTVEMTSVVTPCEVAIIDEIQMMRDSGRGWAWTRALLGVTAQEVHLCGEAAAIDLVKELVGSVGEELEVRRYNRLTELVIEDSPLGSLENIQPGDCIVCFSKNDIYSTSLHLERKGIDCAVIYGGLPPGTKLAQAQKFNDIDDPCKVLIATDAIGMGLNLSIRRVIFYSVVKPMLNEKGEMEMDTIPTHQALQIAGRAGRYGTQFDKGYVTTFKNEDLSVLKNILSKNVDPIEAAGLHPTADQIELFAYHLPQATLSNLIDIFISLCRMDSSHYFMCNSEDFKFLADMIQHVPLPLRARYVFCCAPINRKLTFVCSMFLRMSRQYSKNEVITFDWLCKNVGWPVSAPKTIIELIHLEMVFDVLDLYLWLGYRFIDLFPDTRVVKEMQQELDATIQMGVQNITRLLKNTESKVASALTKVDDHKFMINKKEKSFYSPYTEPEGDDIKGGKLGSLTRRLMEQGLLTPKMLKQLKKELNEETHTTTTSSGRKKRK